MYWGCLAGSEKGSLFILGEVVEVYRLPKVLRENCSSYRWHGLDETLALRNAGEYSCSRNSKYDAKYEPEAHSTDFLVAQLA